MWRIKVSAAVHIRRHWFDEVSSRFLFGVDEDDIKVNIRLSRIVSFQFVFEFSLPLAS
jgi:hypothetical protein